MGGLALLRYALFASLSCSAPLISVANRFELMAAELDREVDSTAGGERCLTECECKRVGTSGVMEQVLFG